jgi:hypothetical protein
MKKPDFTLKFIKDSGDLRQLSETLISLPAFALDIETTDWWNRRRERIALIQVAYRIEGKIKVAIIDALAALDVEPLRLPLKQASVLKIVHNAGFDAARLEKHYKFNVAPLFDTMAVARQSGERKYSLKVQAEMYLGLHLNKSAQTSDWSHRPLDLRQLHYAALDPYATLLLYENQKERGLNGDNHWRQGTKSIQNLLPLDGLSSITETKSEMSAGLDEKFPTKIELSEEAVAVLGIVVELPNRYSPYGLAASVGRERVGLAGWIIDQRLGVSAEPDEETIKLAISDLHEKEFIRITESRRLEATETGEDLWQELKK